MPSHLRIDRGFTIGANQTQYWNWNWFGQAGPNKGPVIFRGMPKGPGQAGNNTVRNVLVTVETLPNAAVVPVTRAHPGFLRVQDQEREEYYRTVRLRNNSVQRPADPKLLTGGNHESDPRYWSGGKDRRHCQSCTKQQSGKG